MASSKNVACGPCKQGKVNATADIWCYNCDIGLCSTCSSLHERYKLTQDHKTIGIKTYKRRVGLNITECVTHLQQLRLYCPSHLMPCCDECISKSHSKCTGIKSLASEVKKPNIEKSKESVEKDINSILQFLDKMANNKSENLRRGTQQYQSIKDSISKFRKEINKHLDHLEMKICKEADDVWGQEKSKLTDFIKEIEEQKKSLKEMQDDLHTVKTHTAILQSFLAVHQIEQQVHRCQLYVEEQNEAFKEVDIKLKENDEIEQMLSKVQSLISLGQVEVDETEITLKKETSVNRKAQVESHKQPNINNMTMNIETTIQTNLKNITSISDLLCLNDGRFIVVEEQCEVRILTSDAKLQKKLPIPGGAWSVTKIKEDTIAITYPLLKAINMFNMENETIIKVITLDKPCWGLFFSNNALVVGLGANEIRIIDLEGNTQKSIEVQSNTRLYHLVYFNDKVIYSDFRGKAVCCIGASGNQIWQYQQDLSGPMGLCTDIFGNILVADLGSDRIIVISKDGQNSKVLITKEDGLNMSRSICFNESSGFICHRLGIYFTKVNLSYE